MKILKVMFDDILIFNKDFVIDFTAQDRIFADSGVQRILPSVSTQQVMSIIGINAVGKTTSLKLLNLALEVVLNNKGLNDENLIPAILLNEKSAIDGITMTVYFYKEDRVFELKSKIKYRRNKDKSIHFYFEDEVLKSKRKSYITSKKNIFDFSKGRYSDEIKRSKMAKESLKVLKDDDSIVITETRDVKPTVNIMFDDVEDKINYIEGAVHQNILNVFDENINRLERVGESTDFTVEFKNSETRIISSIPNLDKLLSSGTLRGQKIIEKAIIALKSGGYLLIDELENHLNKELVKMIINIFNNKDINKNGACLIFTTHYAEILDSFDRMDNIYVLIRTKDYFTDIIRYSQVVRRNELKRSEVVLSNYIKGTAPKAGNIDILEEYICQNIQVN